MSYWHLSQMTNLILNNESDEVEWKISLGKHLKDLPILFISK